MKTIGLIGGMSWGSSVPYYRIVKETIRQRLGGLHSANADPLQPGLPHRRAHGGRRRLELARRAAIERAGADSRVLCTNTMHRVAPAIEAAVRIPSLHIADATATDIRAAGHKTVGLLGTRFTMEQSFHRGGLVNQHGLKVLIPSEQDRAIVHRIIYDQLCLGIVADQSRDAYRPIMAALVDAGAEAIVRGGTEIDLLVTADDSRVPLFDTTTIHARAAAEFSLG